MKQCAFTFFARVLILKCNLQKVWARRMAKLRYCVSLIGKQCGKWQNVIVFAWMVLFIKKDRLRRCIVGDC